MSFTRKGSLILLFWSPEQWVSGSNPTQNDNYIWHWHDHVSSFFPVFDIHILRYLTFIYIIFLTLISNDIWQSYVTISDTHMLRYLTFICYDIPSFFWCLTFICCDVSSFSWCLAFIVTMFPVFPVPDIHVLRCLQFFLVHSIHMLRCFQCFLCLTFMCYDVSSFSWCLAFMCYDVPSFSCVWYSYVEMSSYFPGAWHSYVTMSPNSPYATISSFKENGMVLNLPKYFPMTVASKHRLETSWSYNWYEIGDTVIYFHNYDFKSWFDNALS